MYYITFPVLQNSLKKIKTVQGTVLQLYIQLFRTFVIHKVSEIEIFFFEMHFLHYLLISSLFLNRAHGHNPNKLQKSKDLEGHITAKLKLFNISVSYLKISKNIQKN